MRAFFLRMSGGSIPHRTGRSAVGVALIQPLMTLMHSLRLASNLEQCALLPQTGEQYSATEKQSPRAEVRSVVKSAPRLDPVSLFNRLHRLEVFAAVSITCCLNERVRSRVTHRYFGVFSKGILIPWSLVSWNIFHVMNDSPKQNS